MKKFLLPGTFCLIVLAARGQTSAGGVQQTQPFGIIDTADLRMTSCDFEKDANALVLFDKADVETGFTSTAMLRHKRIKILNDKGRDAADISIEYYAKENAEDVSDVEAETINLENGKIVFVKIDKALIYKQNVDKYTKKITFSFPQVKAGSVIEYSYKLSLNWGGGFPDYSFQGDIPVRYCEFNAAIRNDYAYKMIPKVSSGYTTNTKELWIKKDNDTIGNKYTWAVKNVPSFSDEPYMTSKDDYIQGMQFILTGIKITAHGQLRDVEDSWYMIDLGLLNDPDYGVQLDTRIDDKSEQQHVKLLGTDVEKMRYILGYVKNNVTWNGKNKWYPIDGVKKILEKKTGNCTEMNLVLASFLKQAGLKCFLALTSTRDNGKISEKKHELYQFNKTVVGVIIGDKNYFLDASGKYNLYNDAPFDILNASGLYVGYERGNYRFATFTNDDVARKVVFVNAEIKPDGKLEGTTQINSFDYHRTKSLDLYNTLGETKYTDRLKDNDNSLKILSLKRENVDNDTLPLTETLDFKLDLTGSDDSYIYFNPNLFTSFHTNPFLSNVRISDIDFGCKNYYAINGRYKLPEGYKIDALPKSLLLVMPDKSISFKRVVAEQDGDILVHYVIDFKKAVFSKEEYPSIKDFYKKMFELLNEQIVLKKI